MFPSLIHIKLVPHLTTVLKKKILTLYTLFHCHYGFFSSTTVYEYMENIATMKIKLQEILYEVYNTFLRTKISLDFKMGTDSLTHYVKMPGKVFLRSFLLVSRIQSSYHSASICLRNTWYLKCPAIKDLLYSPNSSLQTGKDDKKDGFIDDR